MAPRSRSGVTRTLGASRYPVSLAPERLVENQPEGVERIGRRGLLQRLVGDRLLADLSEEELVASANVVPKRALMVSMRAEIAARFRDDKDFRGAVSRHLMKQVCEQIRGEALSV